MANLFEDLPAQVRREVFDIILESSAFKLERIVSSGQSTPDGEWLKQDQNEWVTLLQGEAELTFQSGEHFVLRPGDYVIIPSGVEHRVDRTSVDKPTVWLALHYR